MRELFGKPLSDADLDAATRALAAPIIEVGLDRVSLLLVECGGETMAFRAADVAMVIARAPRHRVPHRTNSIFRGIANHEGELLLCFALERALGLDAGAQQAGKAVPGSAVPNRPLVVIEESRRRWAIEVDRIFGVEDLDAAELRKPPLTLAAAHNGCTDALARLSGREVIVLDAKALGCVAQGAIR
ncbi:MAG: chemotaxis protein CheW [Planctomycetota bacterium]|nr:chemotaxis protein CheW [Planctomycetota bacterium]MDA1106515.1 chemotaxis protein CheW [Planctomycetota bacterium]